MGPPELSEKARQQQQQGDSTDPELIQFLNTVGAWPIGDASGTAGTSCLSSYGVTLLELVKPLVLTSGVTPEAAI